MLKYIKFILFISIFFISLTTYAWVVPGTITISPPYNVAWSCNSNNSNYTTRWLKSYTCIAPPEGECTPPLPTCESGTATCTWYSSKITTWYFYSAWYYYLDNDQYNSCSVSMRWTSAIITWWVGCSSDSCNPWSCTAVWYNAINFRVDNIDQLWRNDTSTTSSNSSSCYLQWRYATADNSVLTGSINPIVQNVFVDNISKWCNIKKYRWEWYTYKADENPGCEFYKSKNSNITGQEDLLKWLTITIPWDVSWIWEVQIQIWTCKVTYQIPNQNIASIIRADGTWINSNQKNGFTIPYSLNISGGSFNGQPWLLSKFDKNRLDKCLWEWKNSIAVLVKDMARSKSNWTILDPNTSTFGILPLWRTINIDNSTVKLQLSGDLTTTSLNWTTTIWWFTPAITNNSTIWRNYTLQWNIRAFEQIESLSPNECSNYNWSLTWQCTWSVSWWRIWTAPSWVHPSTWEFMQYRCDTLGPFPTDSECASWCPSWKEWNPNTNQCETASTVCKATVWWVEVVIQDWVNWKLFPSSTPACLAYCIPWHSVWCVVKEAWVYVAPTPEPITCTSPQVLENGVCVTPTPTENYCTLDATLDCILLGTETTTPVPTNQYTVTFDWNLWSWHSPTSKSVAYNTAVWTLPSNPTRTWYTFNGWFTATSWWTQITTSTVVTANVTYYAQWTLVPQKICWYSDTKYGWSVWWLDCNTIDNCPTTLEVRDTNKCGAWYLNNNTCDGSRFLPLSKCSLSY